MDIKVETTLFLPPGTAAVMQPPTPEDERAMAGMSLMERFQWMVTNGRIVIIRGLDADQRRGEP